MTRGALTALLLLATCWVYRPLLHYPFVALDDDVYVFSNPHVLQGLTRANLGWAFATLEAAFFQPLTWLSHMLDVELYGLEAGGHHLSNLFLHLGAVVLLLEFLYFLSARWGASLLVAALFALHPLNVESVAWVAERKNLLSTLLALAALTAYSRYARHGGRVRYWSVMGLFILSLMAKPMLVTLPFLMLLVDLCPLNRFKARQSLQALLLEKLPFLIPALAAGLLTLAAQSRSGALAGLGEVSLPARFGHALAALVHYPARMMVPADLAVFYPAATLTWWEPLAGLLFLSGGAWLALGQYRRRPYLAFGFFWYLISLVPMSGLVQVGGHTVADRYAYVPLIGLFVLLAWGAEEWATLLRRRRLALAGALALLVLLAGLARRQVGFWQSSRRLMSHAIQVAPESVLAHNNLGTVLLEAGDLTGAIRQLEEARRLRPESARVLYNLGLAWSRSGDSRRARHFFSLALSRDPNLAAAHNSLGLLLLREGSLAAAVEHLTRAIRICPDLARAHDNLGMALLGQGHLGAALAEVRLALGIEPRSAHFEHNLGVVLERQGKPREAASHYRRALELDPSSYQTRDNLGLLLLEEGDLQGAERQFLEALTLEPRAALNYRCLARLRLREGKRGESIRLLLRALELAPDDPETTRLLEEAAQDGRP